MEEFLSEKDLKKGTTTIGLVCKDGIVMATEMRATMGNLMATKQQRSFSKYQIT